MTPKLRGPFSRGASALAFVCAMAAVAVFPDGKAGDALANFAFAPAQVPQIPDTPGGVDDIPPAEYNDPRLCEDLGGKIETAPDGQPVCSEIDRHDTFCIVGSVDAFPCRGLFKHVVLCNAEHNRPALNPFFCAAVCAESESVPQKARGARCERYFPPDEILAPENRAFSFVVSRGFTGALIPGPEYPNVTLGVPSGGGGEFTLSAHRPDDDDGLTVAVDDNRQLALSVPAGASVAASERRTIIAKSGCVGGAECYPALLTLVADFTVRAPLPPSAGLTELNPSPVVVVDGYDGEVYLAALRQSAPPEATLTAPAPAPDGLSLALSGDARAVSIFLDAPLAGGGEVSVDVSLTVAAGENYAPLEQILTMRISALAAPAAVVSLRRATGGQYGPEGDLHDFAAGPYTGAVFGKTGGADELDIAANGVVTFAAQVEGVEELSAFEIAVTAIHPSDAFRGVARFEFRLEVSDDSYLLPHQTIPVARRVSLQAVAGGHAGSVAFWRAEEENITLRTPDDPPTGFDFGENGAGRNYAPPDGVTLNITTALNAGETRTASFTIVAARAGANNATIPLAVTVSALALPTQNPLQSYVGDDFSHPLAVPPGYDPDDGTFRITAVAGIAPAAPIPFAINAGATVVLRPSPFHPPGVGTYTVAVGMTHDGFIGEVQLSVPATILALENFAASDAVDLNQLAATINAAPGYYGAVVGYEFPLTGAAFVLNTIDYDESEMRVAYNAADDSRTIHIIAANPAPQSGALTLTMLAEADCAPGRRCNPLQLAATLQINALPDASGTGVHNMDADGTFSRLTLYQFATVAGYENARFVRVDADSSPELLVGESGVVSTSADGVRAAGTYALAAEATADDFLGTVRMTYELLLRESGAFDECTFGNVCGSNGNCFDEDLFAVNPAAEVCECNLGSSLVGGVCTPDCPAGLRLLGRGPGRLCLNTANAGLTEVDYCRLVGGRYDSRAGSHPTPRCYLLDDQGLQTEFNPAGYGCSVNLNCLGRRLMESLSCHNETGRDSKCQTCGPGQYQQGYRCLPLNDVDEVDQCATAIDSPCHASGVCVDPDQRLQNSAAELCECAPGLIGDGIGGCEVPPLNQPVVENAFFSRPVVPGWPGGVSGSVAFFVAAEDGVVLTVPAAAPDGFNFGGGAGESFEAPRGFTVFLEDGQVPNSGDRADAAFAVRAAKAGFVGEDVPLLVRVRAINAPVPPVPPIYSTAYFDPRVFDLTGDRYERGEYRGAAFGEFGESAALSISMDGLVGTQATLTPGEYAITALVSGGNFLGAARITVSITVSDIAAATDAFDECAAGNVCGPRGACEDPNQAVVNSPAELCSCDEDHHLVQGACSPICPDGQSLIGLGAEGLCVDLLDYSKTWEASCGAVDGCINASDGDCRAPVEENQREPGRCPFLGDNSVTVYRKRDMCNQVTARGETTCIQPLHQALTCHDELETGRARDGRCGDECPPGQFRRGFNCLSLGTPRTDQCENSPCAAAATCGRDGMDPDLHRQNSPAELCTCSAPGYTGDGVYCNPPPLETSIDNPVVMRAAAPGYSGSVAFFAPAYPEVTLTTPSSAPDGFNFGGAAGESFESPNGFTVFLDAGQLPNGGDRARAVFVVDAMRAGDFDDAIQITVAVSAVLAPVPPIPTVVNSVYFSENIFDLSAADYADGAYVNATFAAAGDSPLTIAANGVVGTGTTLRAGEYGLTATAVSDDFLGTATLVVSLFVSNTGDECGQPGICHAEAVCADPDESAQTPPARLCECRRNFVGDGSPGECYPLDLIKAAQDNDFALVSIHLESGVVVDDERDADGNTALHWTVDRNNTVIASLLLEHGADVNARKINGDAPMHVAGFVANRGGFVRFLLANGADVNILGRGNRTPLDYAFEIGHAGNQAVLIENNGVCVIRSDANCPTLHGAVADGNAAQALALIDVGGADVNFVNSDGKTHLDLAIEMDSPADVREVLASNGAACLDACPELSRFAANPFIHRPVVAGYSGSVAVFAATARFAVIRAPQSAPEGFNFGGAEGATLAGESGITLFLDDGRLPNGGDAATAAFTLSAARDGLNGLPIDVAVTVLAIGASAPVIPPVRADEYFDEGVITLSAGDYEGGAYDGADFAAIGDGDASSLTVSADGIVGTKITLGEGEYGITVAASGGNFLGTASIIVSLAVLLSGGEFDQCAPGVCDASATCADPDMFDDGDTAAELCTCAAGQVGNGAPGECYASDLIQAVKDQDVRLVSIHLESGIVVDDVRDGHQNTPLHWAADRGNTVIAAMLLAHGADVDARQFTDATPMVVAVNSGHENFIAFLIENGANVNAQNNVLRTPLDWGFVVNRDNRAPERAVLIANNGICVRVTDPECPTLHDAAAAGNAVLASIIFVLVRALGASDPRADPDTTNSAGQAPLHVAAMNGNVALASVLLLQGGADIDITNSAGKVPFDLALEADDSAMQAFLAAEGGQCLASCPSAAVFVDNPSRLQPAAAGYSGSVAFFAPNAGVTIATPRSPPDGFNFGGGAGVTLASPNGFTVFLEEGQVPNGGDIAAALFTVTAIMDVLDDVPVPLAVSVLALGSPPGVAPVLDSIYYSENAFDLAGNAYEGGAFAGAAFAAVGESSSLTVSPVGIVGTRMTLMEGEYGLTVSVFNGAFLGAARITVSLVVLDEGVDECEAGNICGARGTCRDLDPGVINSAEELCVCGGNDALVLGVCTPPCPAGQTGYGRGSDVLCVDTNNYGNTPAAACTFAGGEWEGERRNFCLFERVNYQLDIPGLFSPFIWSLSCHEESGRHRRCDTCEADEYQRGLACLPLDNDVDPVDQCESAQQCNPGALCFDPNQHRQNGAAELCRCAPGYTGDGVNCVPPPLGETVLERVVSQAVAAGYSGSVAFFASVEPGDVLTPPSSPPDGFNFGGGAGADFVSPNGFTLFVNADAAADGGDMPTAVVTVEVARGGVDGTATLTVSVSAVGAPTQATLDVLAEEAATFAPHALALPPGYAAADGNLSVSGVASLDAAGAPAASLADGEKQFTIAAGETRLRPGPPPPPATGRYLITVIMTHDEFLGELPLLVSALIREPLAVDDVLTERRRRQGAVVGHFNPDGEGHSIQITSGLALIGAVYDDARFTLFAENESAYELRLLSPMPSAGQSATLTASVECRPASRICARLTLAVTVEFDAVNPPSPSIEPVFSAAYFSDGIFTLSARDYHGGAFADSSFAAIGAGSSLTVAMNGIVGTKITLDAGEYGITVGATDADFLGTARITASLSVLPPGENQCAPGVCDANASCRDPDFQADNAVAQLCACNTDYLGGGAPGECALDQCASNPCDANASCFDPGDGTQTAAQLCACNSGYSGDGVSCAADVVNFNECAFGDVCGADATCNDPDTTAINTAAELCSCGAGNELVNGVCTPVCPSGQTRYGHGPDALCLDGSDISNTADAACALIDGTLQGGDTCRTPDGAFFAFISNTSPQSVDPLARAITCHNESGRDAECETCDPGEYQLGFKCLPLEGVDAVDQCESSSPCHSAAACVDPDQYAQNTAAELCECVAPGHTGDGVSCAAPAPAPTGTLPVSILAATVTVGREWTGAIFTITSNYRLNIRPALLPPGIHRLSLGLDGVIHLVRPALDDHDYIVPIDYGRSRPLRLTMFIRPAAEQMAFSFDAVSGQPFAAKNLAVDALAGAAFAPPAFNTSANTDNSIIESDGYPVFGGYSVSESGMLTKSGNVAAGEVTIRFRATLSGGRGAVNGRAYVRGNPAAPSGLKFGAENFTHRGDVVDALNADAAGGARQVMYYGQRRGLHFALVKIGESPDLRGTNGRVVDAETGREVEYNETVGGGYFYTRSTLSRTVLYRLTRPFRPRPAAVAHNGWTMGDYAALCDGRDSGLGGGKQWRAPSIGEAAALIHDGAELPVGRRELAVGVPGLLPGIVQTISLSSGTSDWPPLKRGAVAVNNGVPAGYVDGHPTAWRNKMWALGVATGGDDAAHYSAFIPTGAFSAGEQTYNQQPAIGGAADAAVRYNETLFYRGASGYAACVADAGDSSPDLPELSVLEFDYRGKNVLCPLDATPSAECAEAGHPDSPPGVVDSALADNSVATVRMFITQGGVRARLTLRARRFGQRQDGAAALESVPREAAFAHDMGRVIVRDPGGRTGAALVEVPPADAADRRDEIVYDLTPTIVMTRDRALENPPPRAWIVARPRLGTPARLIVEFHPRSTLSRPDTFEILDQVLHLPPAYAQSISADDVRSSRRQILAQAGASNLALFTVSAKSARFGDAFLRQSESHSQLTLISGGAGEWIVSLTAALNLADGAATLNLEGGAGSNDAHNLAVEVRPVSLPTVYVMLTHPGDAAASDSLTLEWRRGGSSPTVYYVTLSHSQADSGAALFNMTDDGRFNNMLNSIPNHLPAGLTFADADPLDNLHVTPRGMLLGAGAGAYLQGVSQIGEMDINAPNIRNLRVTLQVQFGPGTALRRNAVKIMTVAAGFAGTVWSGVTPYGTYLGKLGHLNGFEPPRLEGMTLQFVAVTIPVTHSIWEDGKMRQATGMRGAVSVDLVVPPSHRLGADELARTMEFTLTLHRTPGGGYPLFWNIRAEIRLADYEHSFVFVRYGTAAGLATLAAPDGPFAPPAVERRSLNRPAEDIQNNWALPSGADAGDDHIQGGANQRFDAIRILDGMGIVTTAAQAADGEDLLAYETPTPGVSVLIDGVHPQGGDFRPRLRISVAVPPDAGESISGHMRVTLLPDGRVWNVYYLIADAPERPYTDIIEPVAQSMVFRAVTTAYDGRIGQTFYAADDEVILPSPAAFAQMAEHGITVFIDNDASPSSLQFGVLPGLPFPQGDERERLYGGLLRVTLSVTGAVWPARVWIFHGARLALAEPADLYRQAVADEDEAGARAQLAAGALEDLDYPLHDAIALAIPPADHRMIPGAPTIPADRTNMGEVTVTISPFAVTLVSLLLDAGADANEILTAADGVNLPPLAYVISVLRYGGRHPGGPQGVVVAEQARMVSLLMDAGADGNYNEGYAIHAAAGYWFQGMLPAMKELLTQNAAGTRMLPNVLGDYWPFGLDSYQGDLVRESVIERFVGHRGFGEHWGINPTHNPLRVAAYTDVIRLLIGLGDNCGKVDHITGSPISPRDICNAIKAE